MPGTPKENEQLLWDYATKFLGYGNLDSPIWLVGPEAGGGATMDEVCLRASVWAERGREEVEDLHGYHAKLRLPPKHDWTRNIQPTWGALIRVILALDHRSSGTEKVREFQQCAFGGLDSRNAILDLSQLSSPKMNVWNFGGFGIDWLSTRENYEQCVLENRCMLIKTRLAELNSNSRLVIFFGLAPRHQARWKQIAPDQFEHSEVDGLSWVRSEKTLFVMMRHRDAIRLPGRGACNEYLAAVGAAISNKLKRESMSFSIRRTMPI